MCSSLGTVIAFCAVAFSKIVVSAPGLSRIDKTSIIKLKILIWLWRILLPYLSLLSASLLFLFLLLIFSSYLLIPHLLCIIQSSSRSHIRIKAFKKGDF